MKQAQKNIWGLEVGDGYSYTNKYGMKIIIMISRVEEKSYYYENGCRESWGTLLSKSKLPDFKIIKK